MGAGGCATDALFNGVDVSLDFRIFLRISILTGIMLGQMVIIRLIKAIFNFFLVVCSSISRRLAIVVTRAVYGVICIFVTILGVFGEFAAIDPSETLCRLVAG